MNQEKIGKFIKSLRIKNGYSQSQLAAKLNVTSLRHTAPRIKRHRSQSQRKLNVSVDYCSPLTSFVPLLGLPKKSYVKIYIAVD